MARFGKIYPGHTALTDQEWDRLDGVKHGAGTEDQENKNTLAFRKAVKLQKGKSFCIACGSMRHRFGKEQDCSGAYCCKNPYCEYEGGGVLAHRGICHPGKIPPPPKFSTSPRTGGAGGVGGVGSSGSAAVSASAFFLQGGDCGICGGKNMPADHFLSGECGQSGTQCKSCAAQIGPLARFCEACGERQ